MGKVTIYHGGYMTVQEPHIIAGRNTKDFGPGFYCTIIKEQAERWAKRYNTPVISIVIGAMANDQIYNYVSDYMEGVITRDQFWSLAKFKYPTHQINFCTERALKCIRFRKSEEV